MPAARGAHDFNSQDTKHAIVPLWINGEQEYSSSTFDVITPSTNTPCWRAAAASRDDTLRAVAVAQAAFPAWSQTKPAVRIQILNRAADLLETNIEEYASYMTTEMGAEEGVAKFMILPLAIAMLRDIACQITNVVGTVPVCQSEGTSAIVYKEPYGVTLGLVPWNAPYVFGIRSAATAIATGNTTILKASEMTPRCYWVIGKVFADAGLPKGVLNVLNCPPADALMIVDTMIEHPSIRKINFTGSANVGRMIASKCGKCLKPCLLELGGKNSAIVLPDADLEKAVKECLAGSFLNSGQICMATDRILVHSSIAPVFLDALKAAISAMSTSLPEPPKVISTASKSRLDSLVSSAVSSGAHVLIGNTVADEDDRSMNGNAAATFVPTVLGDVTDEMQIWNDEAFGPVVAYRLVSSEDEAVNIANNTGYGLSVSVFTQDLRKGLALAKRLEAGAVHINSMTIHDEPALPFGGVKNSGWGRFNTAAGMEEFLVTKTVTWDD